MNFKHVLFSSLILSAGLTACSNEELISPTDVVDVTKDAIELGSDFTITGSKMNIADTKSLIDPGTLKPYWEETDTIGAAWYNAVTAIADNGDITSSPLTKLYSNHPFAWLSMVGDKYSAKFQSRTNAFAGAYLLYYPYNYKVASVTDNVPVTIAAEQTMDCTAGKELDAINENMFSYGVAKFVPGGNQTAQFALKQVPVLYELKFKVEEQALVQLIKGLTIEKVIIEAKKSNNSSLFKAGTVTAISSAIDYTKDLKQATYAGTTSVSQYILTVKNPTDDYKITAMGEDGGTKKPFYFSGLPATAGSDEYTFRILTSDGQVFSKTYKATGSEKDKAVVDALNKEGRATSEGGQVKLNISLGLDADDIIYTPEQFSKAFAKVAAQSATAEAAKRTLTLGSGLTLDAVSLNTENADIIIDGEPMIAKSLTVTNGKITLNKAAEVENLTVGVYGNLVATTEALTVANLLSVEGEANIKAEELKDVTIKSRATVELQSAAITGTLSNSGALTLKTTTLKGIMTNTGTLTMGDANVKNEGVFNSEGGTIATATFKLANNKTMTLNGTEVTGTGNGIENIAGATLNITGAEASISKITNAAAKTTAPVAAAGIVNVELAEAANELTAAIENSGNLYLKKGTLVESAANDVKLKASSVMDIATDGIFKLNGNSTDGTGSEAGAKIIVVKTGNIALNSGALATGVIVATEVKAQSELDDKVAITDLTDVILNAANLDITTKLTELQALNLTLKQSIKTGALTMTKALNVDGNVTITSASDVVIALAAGPIENMIKGTLTIGENVELKGDDTTNSIINLQNGAGKLVAGEDGTITFDDITLKN